MGAGTFGCTFSPKIPCLNKNLTILDSNNSYISKVLKGNTNDSLLIDEINISNMILNIPQYQYYFAPILETCPIDISVIPESEREKCLITAKYLTKSETVIEEDSNKEIIHDFTSSALKYIGKRGIHKYLQQMIMSNESLGVKSTYETYTHLLEGLLKMQNMTSSIVHMDIKLDNILIDEKLNVPIIIDFGFSVTNTELLNMVNYEKSLNYRFWSYQYEASDSISINWSIEVEILCYLSQIKFKSRGGKINDVIKFEDIQHLEKVVENYIEKTNMKFFYSLSDQNVSSFYLNTKKYLSTYELSTWKILVDDLLGTFQSWDVYALTLIYSYFINNESIQFEEYYSNLFIQNFKNDLINIILSAPGKRAKPLDALLSTMRHWTNFQNRRQ